VVAGKMNFRNASILISIAFILIVLLFSVIVSPDNVANIATDAVNTRGSLINARLHDIPSHVQEITLHGIHHGASVALTAVQVWIGYELHIMEISFPMGDCP